MDNYQVDQYILVHHHFFSEEDIPRLKQYLLGVDASMWHRVLATPLQDPHIVRVVSIFAGPIGVDRFMIGDIFLGVLKTVTCGGLLIWAIVDCFVVYKSTQKYNFNKLISNL